MSVVVSYGQHIVSAWVYPKCLVPYSASELIPREGGALHICTRDMIFRVTYRVLECRETGQPSSFARYRGHQ